MSYTSESSKHVLLAATGQRVVGYDVAPAALLQEQQHLQAQEALVLLQESLALAVLAQVHLQQHPLVSGMASSIRGSSFGTTPFECGTESCEIWWPLFPLPSFVLVERLALASRSRPQTSSA